jgi:hypothetical protein
MKVKTNAECRLTFQKTFEKYKYYVYDFYEFHYHYCNDYFLYYYYYLLSLLHFCCLFVCFVYVSILI